MSFTASAAAATLVNSRMPGDDSVSRGRRRACLTSRESRRGTPSAGAARPATGEFPGFSAAGARWVTGGAGNMPTPGSAFPSPDPRFPRPLESFLGGAERWLGGATFLSDPYRGGTWEGGGVVAPPGGSGGGGGVTEPCRGACMMTGIWCPLAYMHCSYATS